MAKRKSNRAAPHVDQSWPKCHFRTMTLHECDSDMSGNSDGFQCDYCGHEVALVEWIKAQEKAL
ncbi:Uncharacterised protein [Serratia marcescens]|nr:Uncharacterised protein [Serratia marcescens]CVD94670.1 Uncharacterised protein [Serratia marcescens]